MRILISGAGVAGLAAAYWLKRYGFTPTIVEQAPRLLAGGHKIDVRGSAVQVLRRMGIYDVVAAENTDMQGALLVDKDGNVINKVSGEVFGNRAGEDVEILRGTLCRILCDQITDVEFIFGDSIKEICELSQEVHVSFQKHQSRTFDLVIGADGVHSNVRRLVFGDEAHFARELGIYLCAFTVPNYLNLQRLEMQYSELGKMVVLWNCRGDDDNMKACFAFTAPSNSIDLKNVAQQQQVLKTVYKDINWEVPKLLQMMPHATDFYFDAAAQVHMNKWSKGRVILLGDAAYAASTMSGQGTSLALIGAHVLAGELSAAPGSYQSAFSQYEQALRPFVKVNQDLGIKVADMMKSQEKNSLLSWSLNQLMRILPGRLTGLLIKFFIYLSAKRVTQAANAVTLKDY